MRAIIIDDNEKFVNKLCAEIGNNEKKKIKLKLKEDESRDIKFKDDSPRIIAQAIIDTFKKDLIIEDYQKQSDTYYIFINIEGKFGRSNRQDQKGVEILMWLRCKYRICNPIILYSFQSNKQLLKQKPEHFIIDSEGCYHYQLPYDFSKLKEKVNENKFDCINNWERLKIFLKPTFNIEDIRHQEANWWGIKKLFDVHNKINESKFVYPTKVSNHLENVSSLIGQFIHDNVEIENNYKRKEINKLRKKLFGKQPTILHIDDQWNDGWSEIFCRMIFENFTVCKDKHFNVFRLDNKPQFYSLLEVEKFAINNLMDEIISKHVYKFDFILLDLRLKGKSEEDKPVEELSGAILLKMIREKFKGIPIIITTASNKFWSYAELIRLGADAYWNKEGIDNQLSSKKSIENYYKFLFIADRLTDDDYKFLREQSRNYEQLFSKDDNNHWWKTKNWNFQYEYRTSNKTHVIIPKITNPDIGLVKEIVNETLSLLRSHLQVTKLNIGYDNWSNEEWYIASQIIRHLSSIIEVVHEFDKISENYSPHIGRLINDRFDNSLTLYGNTLKKKVRRNDKIGYELFLERNKASHFAKAKVLVKKDYVEFFKKIYKYLTEGPDEKTTLEIRYEKDKIMFDGLNKPIVEER